jgi:hypothetical protein
MYIVRENSLDSEFWSGVYHGRPIAVLRRSDGWHVYLDHLLQHNMVFITASHARSWLTKRVDNQRARDDRHAVAA